MPKLILKRKAEVLREFPLQGTNSAFTVGSEPGNDVTVMDKLVSMTHFQIERQGQQFFVRDLKSAFGTYINGTKIGSLQEIHDGDVIQVGEHTLVFQNTADGENSRENTPTAGQSFSDFLGEVKDAVIGDYEDEAGQQRRASAAKAKLKGTAASQADDNKQDAAEDFDLNGLEEEISEVLHKAGVKRESPASSGDATPYKKSPYYLLAIHGPYLGKKYQLNFGETKIGRDSKLNDIVIRQNPKGEVDPSISRRHATITYRDSKFYFTDKRSQSRSFVNQQKVAETEELRLTPGDEVEIISDQQSTIFRFVAEGHWDFSSPKRAGQWWLRYRTPALNAATAVAILLSLIFTLLGWRQRALLTNVPAPFAVQAKTFTKLNLIGNLKTLPAGPYRDLIPAPVLADLNGDHEVDILVTQASGVLLAVSGESRKPMWEATAIILNRSCPPVTADVNGNGMADIIALTADGHLVAIDGLFGAEIWTSPFFERDMLGPPVVADFNGDGYVDVAVISAEGKLNVGYSQVFNLQWVNIDIGLACQAPLSAGDLDGDEDSEIFIGTERGIVLIYDGVERRITTTFDFNEELNKLKGSFFTDNPIGHPIGLADLNGDDTPDLVMTSQTGNLLCVSLVVQNSSPGVTLRSLWWASLASGRKNETNFPYPFAFADLDEDDSADLIALSDDGSVKAFRGQSAVGQQQAEIWQSPVDSISGWLSSPIVCDFNKDGVSDVAMVNEKRALKILNGKTGQILWRDDQALAGLTSMPLLADLVDDTDLDIVLLAHDGTINQFVTNRRTLGGSILWGQKFGNASNTSAPARSEPATGRYTLQILAGILVTLGLAAGNIFYHYNRRRLIKA